MQQTNAYTAARGDMTAMRPLAKLLKNDLSSSGFGRVPKKALSPSGIIGKRDYSTVQ